MSERRMERLSIAQAAIRLRLNESTVRRRIRRGELTATRDNRGRLWIELPAQASPAPTPSPTDPALVAELRAAVQRLERELGDAKAERDHWRALADAERQRVDRLLGGRAERRPWPGLKAWWRRVWDGER